MVQQLNKPFSQKLEPNIDPLITECEDFYEIEPPNIDHLITEDDTPVDNFYSAKQQRFLTSILYSAKPIDIFLADANVGIYYSLGKPPIIPDVFLSLDVQTPQNLWEKAHRCYLVWEFGKVPEVAIEIVSNKVGEELGKKLKIYEQMRVSYYVVYDPGLFLSDKSLRIFEIRGSHYFETDQTWLDQVNLGLTLWSGEFEGVSDEWLRWCDHDGNLLLTGDEQNHQTEIKANQAEIKAAKLAEQLRALGIEPEL